MVNSDPKSRILDSALVLFARHGYDGTGVRDIAQEAEVNVSMISYYFGGKIGILKAIIEMFFHEYSEVFLKAFRESKTRSELSKGLVENVVGYIRENKALCKCSMYELPFDIPEIALLKASFIKKLKTELMEYLVLNFQINPEFEKQLIIIGPGIVSLIFSNFLLGPVVSHVFDREFDDEFYESYIDTMATFIEKGLEPFFENQE